jgi:hypothetical protein
MLVQLSLRAIALALLVATAGRTAVGDMQIDPSDPAVSQRFYSTTNTQFWAASYDLSGVGNTNGMAGNGQWVTAISPNYGLTASHYAAAGNVTFITASGASVTATINGSVSEIGGSDLELVRFSQPLPPDVKTYAIAANNQAALIGAPIMSVGVPWAVGRNTIAGFQTETLGPSTGTVLNYNWDPTSSTFSDHLQSGDSGGPTFEYGPGGSMLLVGIHWNIGGSPTGQPDSGDTFVSAYLSQIAAGMALIPPTTATFVPEPASLALLGVGSAFGLVVTRRRRAIK